jgi:D-sedoheptulose 7-phosphate isomerase
VEALGEEGDLLVAISTSGQSLNVLEAVKVAKQKKMKTVGLTGKDGGKLAHLTHLNLNVNSTEVPRIQEIHLFLLHTICEIVEMKLTRT